MSQRGQHTASVTKQSIGASTSSRTHALTTHSLTHSLTHYSLDVLLELAAEVEGLQLDVLPQRLEEEHDEQRGGEQAGRRGVRE